MSSQISRVLSKDPLLASLVTAFLAYVQDGGYAAEEGFLVTLACKKLEIVIVYDESRQYNCSSLIRTTSEQARKKDIVVRQEWMAHPRIALSRCRSRHIGLCCELFFFNIHNPSHMLRLEVKGRRDDGRFSVTRSQFSCASPNTDAQRRCYWRCVCHLYFFALTQY